MCGAGGAVGGLEPRQHGRRVLRVHGAGAAGAQGVGEDAVEGAVVAGARRGAGELDATAELPGQLLRLTPEAGSVRQRARAQRRLLGVLAVTAPGTGGARDVETRSLEGGQARHRQLRLDAARMSEHQAARTSVKEGSATDALSATRRHDRRGRRARAGVSRAHAARALGGYGAVSEAVLSRVTAAAEELGYRANSLAKSVSTGRSQSVGVVVGDIENPFFALSVRGISDTLRRAGYDVTLMNTGESLELEVDAVRALDAKRVDGFLVAPVLAPEGGHLRSLVDAGRPLVLFDRDIPEIPAPSVVVDVRAAAHQLVDDLVADGHRRIGFVSTLSSSPALWQQDPQVAHTPVGRRLLGLGEAMSGHDIA